MYAKIFAQIYDGTLCTNHPWQALVTFQQMLVLADRSGNLDMTSRAISRRTGIPLEIIELGISELLLPDPESRTPDAGGRRIVPLVEGRDWGWTIVNYEAYHKIKSEEERREYHRRYYQKNRSVAARSTEKVEAQLTQTNSIDSIHVDVDVDVNKPSCSSGDELPAGFAEFWAAYPKKVGKRKCISLWKLLKVNGSLPKVLSAIAAQKNSDQWKKEGGQFIPLPATWLGQGRWDDEVVSSTLSQSSFFSGAV